MTISEPPLNIGQVDDRDLEKHERYFLGVVENAKLGTKDDLGEGFSGPGARPEGLGDEARLLVAELGSRQARLARLRAAYAAYVGYELRTHSTYTMGAARWDGIAHHRNPWGHPRDSPRAADCSSFCSWALWIATRDWGLGDFVNGYGWRAGWTGTMTSRGIPAHVGELLLGDLVFYGGTWSVPQHVAMFIGHRRVVSMGVQGDPRIYPTNLYGVLPIVQARRYIRG